MIVLVNPRATAPRNRRAPLSLLHLVAALEGVEWEIVDGNIPGVDVTQRISDLVGSRSAGHDPVDLVAFTVMPGPQLQSAVDVTRSMRRLHPSIPTVWGGYFPTLYPEPVLSEPSVDWLVIGQGEEALADLVRSIREGTTASPGEGLLRQGDNVSRGGARRRRPKKPDGFPELAWDRLPMHEYLHPTFLGRRTGVYQSSVGCSFRCSFCGVAGMWDGRQRFEAPERTERQLRRLVDGWGMDGLHFYDHNFFAGEAHCRELAGRLATLDLSWWCEARIDAMLRYSDDTWRRLRDSGLRMVYCGAESGSDAALERMDKHLTVAQVEEFAARTKDFGIVPELSFCLGEPENPEKDVEASISLIRRIMSINPGTEIVLYYYTPTPHVGDPEDEATATPSTLDEWLQPEWQNWSTHTDPQLPWLHPSLRRRVGDFELVLRSRFPSVHDWRTPAWARPALKAAAWWRWRRGEFSDPSLLRSLRSRVRIPKHDPQAYGHLRGSGKGTT